MSVNRHTQIYDRILCVPGDDGPILGGRAHQLQVADILAFADYLREQNVHPSEYVFDTAAFTPQPIRGLQVLRETSEPVGGQEVPQ